MEFLATRVCLQVRQYSPPEDVPGLWDSKLWLVYLYFYLFFHKKVKINVLNHLIFVQFKINFLLKQAKNETSPLKRLDKKLWCEIKRFCLLTNSDAKAKKQQYIAES